MSGLSRMAKCEHRQVEIMPGDTVIFAANPIPGNEIFVSRTVDNLFRLGADVIYESVSGTHVSGHGSQEDIKMMLNLLKTDVCVACPWRVQDVHTFSKNWLPQWAFPATMFPLLRSANSGVLCRGCPPYWLRPVGPGHGGRTGRIGDVGNIVLRDRKQLSQTASS